MKLCAPSALLLTLALILQTSNASHRHELGRLRDITSPAPARGQRRLVEVNNTDILALDTFYDDYATLDEYEDRISALELQCPDYVSVKNLTHLTYEGRVIRAITINGKSGAHKKIFLNGLQHAREWVSGMAVMYIAETLAAELSSADSNSLIHQYEYLIVPVVNPDGYKFTMNSEGQACSSGEQMSQECDRLWRKNRSRETFRSRCRGVDLNRNWPMDYGAHGMDIASSNTLCDNTYRGEHYFSEPETMSICEYLADATGESALDLCSTESPHAATGNGHATIVAAIDFHSFGQLVLGGWAHTNQPTPRALKSERIGHRMIEKLKPEVYIYGEGDAGGLSYLASGVLPDWLQYAFGAYAYTLELPPITWSMGGFSLSTKRIRETCSKAYQALLGMLEELDVSNEDEDSLDYVLAPGVDLQGDTCKIFNTTLQVDIDTDLYPSEISWELLHGNGDVVLRWARTRYGPTTDYSGLTAEGGSIIICTPGVYLFVIRDTFGDGLCCESGSGGFTLSLDGQELHNGHGDYKNMTAVIVKLDLDPAIQAIDQSTDVAAVVASLEQNLSMPKIPPPPPPLMDPLNPSTATPAEPDTVEEDPFQDTPAPSVVSAPQPSSAEPLVPSSEDSLHESSSSLLSSNSVPNHDPEAPSNTSHTLDNAQDTDEHDFAIPEPSKSFPQTDNSPEKPRKSTMFKVVIIGAVGTLSLTLVFAGLLYRYFYKHTKENGRPYATIKSSFSIGGRSSFNMGEKRSAFSVEAWSTFSMAESEPASVLKKVSSSFSSMFRSLSMVKIEIGSSNETHGSMSQFHNPDISKVSKWMNDHERVAYCDDFTTSRSSSMERSPKDTQSVEMSVYPAPSSPKAAWERADRPKDPGPLRRANTGLGVRFADTCKEVTAKSRIDDADTTSDIIGELEAGGSNGIIGVMKVSAMRDEPPLIIDDFEVTNISSSVCSNTTSESEDLEEKLSNKNST